MISSTVMDTYSRHLEVPQHTSSLSSLYTSIPYLRWSRVAMHLRQLQLGLSAGSLGKTQVADDVSEGLPVDCT
jgi:hypothetical protein